MSINNESNTIANTIVGKEQICRLVNIIGNPINDYSAYDNCLNIDVIFNNKKYSINRTQCDYDDCVRTMDIICQDERELRIDIVSDKKRNCCRLSIIYTLLDNKCIIFLGEFDYEYSDIEYLLKFSSLTPQQMEKGVSLIIPVHNYYIVASSKEIFTGTLFERKCIGKIMDNESVILTEGSTISQEDMTAIIEANKHFNVRKDHMFSEEELSFIIDEINKADNKEIQKEKEMIFEVKKQYLELPETKKRILRRLILRNK